MSTCLEDGASGVQVGDIEYVASIKCCLVIHSLEFFCQDSFFNCDVEGSSN